MAEDSEARIRARRRAPTADPAAIALALAGASRERGRRFLHKQRRASCDDQRDHLHEQFEHLLLSAGNGWAVSATASGGAAGDDGRGRRRHRRRLGAAAWNAAQADGMVVDAFSVPPQSAQAGITGEVVADDLTARIGAIRDIAQSHSFGHSKNVRKDSAEDIKVEIPETGVSLGQAWRYLRLWLGHERHLSGNLRLTGEGKIALTVALDGERAASGQRRSGDLDKLEQEAAEQIFANVDPTNIVIYLRRKGADAEALAAAERATQVAAGAAERADAYSPVERHDRAPHGRHDPARSRARADRRGYRSETLTARLEMMRPSS